MRWPNAVLLLLLSGSLGAPPEAPAGPTLAALARARGIHFGGNLPSLVHGKAPNNWESSPTVPLELALAAAQFTILSAGWESFDGHAWLGDGQYDYAGTAAVSDWCAAHGLAFHFHGAGYGSRVSWWKGWAANSPDELAAVRRIYERYLTDTADRFKGRVAVYDVCNEQVAVPYSGRGWFGQFPFRRAYRTDPNDPASELEYLRRSFRLLHERDPAARLVWLDFNNEVVCPKSDFMLEVCRRLLAEGIPLHGIGFQMHLDTKLRREKGQPYPTDDAYFASVAANFQRFADLGLAIWITELDVALDPAGDLPTELVRQAAIYGRVVATAVAQPKLAGIKVWGILDGNTWGVVSPQRPNLFDELGRPKPAFFAVQRALAQQP